MQDLKPDDFCIPKQSGYAGLLHYLVGNDGLKEWKGRGKKRVATSKKEKEDKTMKRKEGDGNQGTEKFRAHRFVRFVLLRPVSMGVSCRVL